MLDDEPSVPSDGGNDTPTISAGLATLIKSTAATAVFESYAEYLLHHQLVGSKQEAFDKVAGIISVAMDRGDCSVVTMNQVKAFIDECPVMTEQLEAECKCHHAMKHIVKMMLCQLDVNAQGVFNEQEVAEFNAFQTLAKQYHEAKQAIVAKYGSEIQNAFLSIIRTYEPNFDKGFIEEYNCA